ncbi:hypothetical protein O7634_14085 [Micromonospora sp. WMMD1120]|uniref:hypothetical protein n=1 Tax=Micromonospora sp. WMMD1120 TaxID=3016106 RepID=UPI002416187D|nr:hypothetical protein [Micromonospora sp. WMMD1120]MDG4807881.1 hypothetical protein [Micromonospora sp. WMMD1120]
MRDDQAFIERIHRDLADVRWPEPAEIRARARRRSRRTAIAAATAVLAVVGATAGALVHGNHRVPATPVAASVSPSAPVRAEIALESLVQVADLAQPAQVQLSQSGFAEPVLIQTMLGYCRERKGITPVWPTSRWSRSQTLLRETPNGADDTRRDLLLSQDVYRVTAEQTRSFAAELDHLVAPCAEWQSVGPYEMGGVTGTGAVMHRWAVVQRGFAGDEAMLLRHTVSQPVDSQTGRPLGTGPGSSSTAVVRVGDLVTVLNLGKDGTEPELRRVAEVAARRLCAAANPGC